MIPVLNKQQRHVLAEGAVILQVVYDLLIQLYFMQPSSCDTLSSHSALL